MCPCMMSSHGLFRTTQLLCRLIDASTVEINGSYNCQVIRRQLGQGDLKPDKRFCVDGERVRRINILG